MSATEVPFGLIHPVVLPGSVGSRLWPLSRELYLKLLLPLASANTLLQDTAAQVAAPELFAATLVDRNCQASFHHRRDPIRRMPRESTARRKRREG